MAASSDTEAGNYAKYSLKYGNQHFYLDRSWMDTNFSNFGELWVMDPDEDKKRASTLVPIHNAEGDRLINAFYRRTNFQEISWKNFTGFFQLIQFVGIKEIRMRIFRMIGAVMIKKSVWQYITHSYPYRNQWGKLLADYKKKMEEDIYNNYLIY